jgi:hypothetical protein
MMDIIKDRAREEEIVQLRKHELLDYLVCLHYNFAINVREYDICPCSCDRKP